MNRIAIALVIASLGLAACGKKGDVLPPPGYGQGQAAKQTQAEQHPDRQSEDQQ